AGHDGRRRAQHQLHQELHPARKPAHCRGRHGRHPAAQGDLFSSQRALQAAQAAPCREPHNQPPRATVPREPAQQGRGRRRCRSVRIGATNMTSPVAPASVSTAKRRIRVLIVDDSALVRSLLTDILRADPGIEVVGVASDAHIAREKIKALNPDVLTLDVEMPKMDGITFLKNLMRLRPMPVVMVSSLTERGADVTLDALALGAVDYLSKPKIDLAATLKDYSEELIEKIKTASRASVRALDPHRAAAAARPSLSADAVLPRSPRAKPLR